MTSMKTPLADWTDKSRELAPNLSLAGIATVVERSDGRLSVLLDGLGALGLQ